ncbi:MAG: DUF2064 domain-containing protein [Dermatophilaceae bacterium]
MPTSPVLPDDGPAGDVADTVGRERHPRHRPAPYVGAHDVEGSVLVVAKAPRPGEAKTRLAAAVDPAAAADLAAAALLDTLDAAAEAFPAGRRVLSMAGDLAGACREPELRAAMLEWAVVGQCDGAFGERLADAHRQAHQFAGGPVVQVGMDTPHLDPALLRSLSALAQQSGQPVLGPAEDGGWWVLVTCTPDQADPLSGVPMSRPDTGRLTAAALAAAGTPARFTVTLRDIDIPADAHAAAAVAPGTRFARAWRRAIPGDVAGVPVDDVAPDVSDDGATPPAGPAGATVSSSRSYR